MSTADSHAVEGRASGAAAPWKPRVIARLTVASLALLASASGLLAQGPGVARDIAADEFRRITSSRDSLSDGARAQWFFAVFDTAARGPWRAQPQDTVTDASGERAIFRRARPDWENGDLARWESALAALASIDTTRLDDGDRLSWAVTRSEVSRNIALAGMPGPYLPLTNNMGLHHIIWFYGSEYLPSESVADYDIVLAHLNGVALEIDDMMRVMRQAQREGIMPPRALMSGVADALREAIVDDPMTSGYLAKFSHFPGSIAPAERERLRGSAIRIYVTKIRPAYERLLAYATESYIPGASDSRTGLSTFPGGGERYALIVRLRAGTSDLSPLQLHQMALADVARQAATIDSFRVALGYGGTYREFLDFLRNDRRFVFPDSAAFVRAARDIAKRVDQNIFRMFHTVPRLPFGIEAARSSGGGLYRGGSITDGRPGMVRLFFSSDEPGPTWRLPSLMLHEGAPGHHFSHALNLENGIPRFRGLGSFRAFSEGWAMYAADMGEELGVYDDDYATVGHVVGDSWRSIRAVLDTGFHGLGWTWDECIDYARANSPEIDAFIEGELRAIMSTPGLVLSYKLGHWKFLELRALAERELGDAFDVRAFHDALLEDGEMPLDILDARTRQWVALARSAE